GQRWQLKNPRNGRVTAIVDAAAIFEHIINKAWETGDPGIIFATAMEAGNPTPWIGKYESTNPCAEQPLLPYEACVLGSINLTHCVNATTGDNRVESPVVGFNFRKLEELTRLGVGFLDRCIDIQAYTLPEIEAMHKNGNRKIGLGVMGYADVLSQMGIRYGSPAALDLAMRIMSTIQETAHDESQNLGRAINKPFPNYNSTGEGMYKYFPEDHLYFQPRRNATVTTIAPTGTISIIAGCSSGIEPHFALSTKRTNVLDGEDLYDFNPVLKKVLSTLMAEEHAELSRFVADNGFLPDYAPSELIARFPTVVGNDIEVEDHLRTQAAFQKHTDNGVSKTVNLPKECSRGHR
ncbi:hypothetical protein LCGC14_2234290, partial [marine sediment metagenome]